MKTETEVIGVNVQQAKESHLALREKTILLLLTILVSLSRIPFLTADYGFNADAWRIVNATHEIAFTGDYFASQLLVIANDSVDLITNYMISSLFSL